MPPPKECLSDRIILYDREVVQSNAESRPGAAKT
jgi:hypothetical protein